MLLRELEFHARLQNSFNLWLMFSITNTNRLIVRSFSHKNITETTELFSKQIRGRKVLSAPRSEKILNNP